jgi:exopolysaccharide biosynthesis predicted pyruvyltransferase EpsI
MNPDSINHATLLDLVLGEKRLVFVPNVGNLGDALIAHSTYSFFAVHNIRFTIARVKDDVKGACVLVGGGGNLIEGRYNDLSKFLTRCGTHNRIIILPHTIVGNVPLWLSLQNNLDIFARERETHRFLTTLGLSHQQIHLGDDMAFWLTGQMPTLPAPQQNAALVCLRRDSESRNAIVPPVANFDVSALMFHDWSDPDVARLASEMFVTLIARYESIITDRLHVAIAGYLLGREVTLLPNSYFKNRAVYDFSLSLAPNVRFLDGEAAGELFPGER